MIYYRDKILNNLFEDKNNSNIIDKTLNYISQNPSVGDDETLADIAYKVYKNNEFNLLDTSISAETENKKSVDTQNIVDNVNKTQEEINKNK